MSVASVRILRLAAGGDGVGEWQDGRVAFVPRTAPGDLVRARLLKARPRHVRAAPEAILEPGAGRVEPRCRHYGPDRCGGCQLQHVDLGTQLQAKRAIVGDALRRIGKLDVGDPEIHPSEDPWGYRNKVTLSFRDGPRPIGGFHRWDDPDLIFPLERCEIAAPALRRLWDGLRTRLTAIPRGTDRLVLREGGDGSCHVTARVPATRGWPGAEALADGLADAGTSATLWVESAGGEARPVAPEGSRGGSAVQVFEQVHTAMGDRIRRRAVALVGAGPDTAVWDLYAGTGRASTLLAAAGARVESVEQDRRAVRLAGGDGGRITRHVGRVEDRLATLDRADGVLVNPPRTGLGPRVTGMLREGRPDRIVYVSCDPATLARDLAGLAPDYRVGSVEAFDLFPQTAHVETVVAMDRQVG